MNPLLLFCASGESLYVGSVLLIAAVALSVFQQKPKLRLLRMVVTWLGSALIVMSSAPLNRNWWTVLGIAFVVWLLVTAWFDRSRDGFWRVASGIALVSVIWVFLSHEWIARREPRLAGPSADHLVVLGDSISSGLDSSTPSWVSLLELQTGARAKNLSLAGARVADGMAMVQRVTSDDNLVVVELGGNDLLGDLPAAAFERSLISLLSSLTRTGRTVVMFELPLLPTKVEFGRIQRQVAAAYGVVLIPKRFLASILNVPGATTDGLHLSGIGARKMTSLMAALLSPVLESSRVAPSDRA